MNILRIKDLLMEKKMSGKDLADKIGLTPASISNIMQGNSFPKPETLLKISEALDVDVRDLFVPTRDDGRERLYTLKNGVPVEVGSISKEKL